MLIEHVGFITYVNISRWGRLDGMISPLSLVEGRYSCIAVFFFLLWLQPKGVLNYENGSDHQNDSKTYSQLYIQSQVPSSRFNKRPILFPQPMLIRRKRCLGCSKLMFDDLGMLLATGCDCTHERLRTSRNSLYDRV